jgi:ferric-dicitrate binding protein FerR (iron transport regulator)
MKKEECIEIFDRYIKQLATADEIQRLSTWIKNNQEISEWLEQQIQSSSSTIDNEVQMRMLKNIKSGIFSDTKNGDNFSAKSGIRIQLNRWMRVAAIFILPMLTAAGTYYYMSGKPASNPMIVSVEKGQKANITLPDGSRVWLNSQSKLTYKGDFNVSKRELELEGEAYFDVAHNPQKPFIVHSNGMMVEALGTAFSVKAYSEDNYISSTLLRGKVRVTTAVGESILLPNERVLYDKANHKMEQSKVVNAADFTGWIHNELRFENESLGEIAKNIQRIYSVEIVFASEKLKSHRYTGTVDNKSLESVLNIISLTSPILFQIDKQKVTLSENKKIGVR